MAKIEGLSDFIPKKSKKIEIVEALPPILPGIPANRKTRPLKEIKPVVLEDSAPILPPPEKKPARPADKPTAKSMVDPDEPTKIDMYPPIGGQPIKGDVVKAMSALLSRFRKDDILKATFDSLAWPEFLMAVSNICMNKAIAYRYKGDNLREKIWTVRAYYFHDAIDLNKDEDWLSTDNNT